MEIQASMSSQPSGPSRQKEELPVNKFWPRFIIGILGSVILFNVYFVYTAVSTGRGVVERSPYEAGVRYEETVSKLRASKELGWDVRLQSERVGSQQAFTVSALRSVGAESVRFVSGALSLTPLTGGGAVERILFSTEVPGALSVSTDKELGGTSLFELQLLSDAGEEYLAKGRLTVRPDGTLSLLDPLP